MNPSAKRTRGFSLIEVMIAVVILSFGLLALAALQAGLFRAGAEAKARANATAIAQQVVEDARTFAYALPPAGTYTSPTYQSLDTGALTSTTVGGVTYAGCRQVVRYRYNSAAATPGFASMNTVSYAASVSATGTPVVTCENSAGTASGAVDASIPEFKQVKVAVAWVGPEGAIKSVELTDSVSSVSPADSIQVVKTPTASSQGPQVYIVPPNQNNPGVVPIAIGTGDEQKAAASSNPKPEQFVDDVSSATLFSVQTFTGDSSGQEVLLNRKIDVAAVSCVCSDDGAVSTASNPAYQPTIWNGKQLAYMEPQTAPVGKKIGTAVVSNSDRNIQSFCTVCCRDHHDAANQVQKVDPYRTLINGVHAHYGYKQQGNGYLISAGLFPVGSDTNNQYMEACRLIRVNGQMRLAVDARQNNLMVTPLNSAGTGFQQTDFISRYSGFVSSYVNSAVQNIPAGYPSPSAVLPGPTSAQLTGAPPTGYSDIVSPSDITLSSAGDTRKLVAFGLYVDYLSADTLFAYNCARTSNNTGSCQGYGTRNALEYIPFYAVNVANLGDWASATPGVVSVAGASFDNRGLLATDGGIVTAMSAGSNSSVPITETINISNSGLTATEPVDPDDQATTSLVSDAQGFLKSSGSGSSQSNTLALKVGTSSTLTVNKLAITSPAGSSVCSYLVSSKSANCTFNGPATISVRIANFTTSKTTGGTTTIYNRKVCLPADARIASVTSSGDNTTSESVTFSVGTLQPQNYTLTFNVVNEADTCPTGAALN